MDKITPPTLAEDRMMCLILEPDDYERDGLIALIYNDSHYKFILKICKELGMNVELWGRPYQTVDRNGISQPYFTVWLIIPGKTGKDWEYFKKSDELQKIEL